MKIIVKIISGLLILAILLVVGYFGYRFYKNGFDFKKTFGIGVSESLVEEKELETIKEINVSFNTGDVSIKPSEDNKTKIMLYSDRNCEHSIVEEEGIVKVTINEKKLKFLDRIFNHKQSGIVIYLPKDFEGNVNIDGDVGDITMDDYPYVILNIKSNVGDVYVDGIKDGTVDLNVGSVKIKKLYSNCNINIDAGNLRMKEVIILKDSSINVDAGNVTIEETNDIKIEGKVDLGRSNIEKNNEEALNTLKIEVRAGNIDVLAPKVEEETNND